MPTARARWSTIVRELDASGLPLREFARRRAVNAGTLSWWRSTLRREERRDAPPPVFTELVVDERPRQPSSSPTLLVALPRVAAHVHVDSQTDLVLLRAVLEALC